jgi:hypothetical protein
LEQFMLPAIMDISACDMDISACDLFTGQVLANTIVQVVIGGGIVFAIGVWLGRIGAG